MIFTAAAALPIYSLVQLYGACRANEMKFMQIAARPAGPSTLLYRGGDASNLYHEGETVLPPFATVNVARLERSPDRRRRCVFSRSRSFRLQFAPYVPRYVRTLYE